jgi:hypothetical protein
MGNTYPLATTVLALELQPSGLAVFKGKAVTAQCPESSGEDKGLTAGTPVLGKFEITFASCSFCKEVNALNLFWRADITAAGGGNGTMKLLSSGFGTPKFELVGCAKNNTCFFEENMLTLSIKGGKQATLTANAVLLEVGFGSGPLCGLGTSIATWSGTYNIVSPSPLYVI